MKDWSTDKLVSLGLVAMGILSIVGYVVHSVMTGDNRGTEIPLAIIGALAGYMGKGHVMQNEQAQQYQQDQSNVSHALGQAATILGQAQQIADASDVIVGALKRDKQNKGQSGESSAEK